ncbi:InlB B-repeat-containing protein [Bacilliculturomica massiliensis]|uniref:InlB B-repeat-containing protein n=1 Tax=Bacilliculturomica massiliensis TaxID=1917867 RepID=UPI001031FA39|nr:InlB B-repeat-containing protein [Bacilliculturomica massiliensis]
MKKKKRIAWLLALFLLGNAAASGLFGLGGFRAGSAFAAIDSSVNTGSGVEVKSDLFTSAVVRNVGAGPQSNGTATKIEVEVRLKDGAQSGKSVYAMVLSAAEYESNFGNGALANKVDPTTYFNLTQLTANYYAMGTAKTGGGNTLTVPLVEASTVNFNKLNTGGTVASKAMPTAAVKAADPNTYFDEYRLVVFTEQVGSMERYYVDGFYIDADGYVRTDSYLIRYNANNPAQGEGSVTGVPARTIIRALPGGTLAAGAQLSAGKPVRYGYAFQGWASSAGGTVEYEAGATYPKPANLHQVYDLYAVWKVVPVGILQPELIAGAGQVNRAYEFRQEGVLTEATDSNSQKRYTVTKVERQKEGGAAEDITDNNELLDPSTHLPRGLSLSPYGTGGKGIALTGTPQVYSDEAIILYLEVEDRSNATTAGAIRLTIPYIERGAQDRPRPDWNTGLESVGISAEGMRDGALIGFYPTNLGTDPAEFADKQYEYRFNSALGAASDSGGWSGWKEVSKEAAAAQNTSGQAIWRNLREKVILTPGEETIRQGGEVSDGTGGTVILPPGWIEEGTASDSGVGSLKLTGLPAGTYEVRLAAQAQLNQSESVFLTVSVGGAAVQPPVSTDSGLKLIYNLMGAVTTGEAIEVTGPDGSLVTTTDPAVIFRGLSGLKAGAIVTIPAIEVYRDGYTFAGWHVSTDENPVGLVSGGSTVTVNRNTAVSAVLRKVEGSASPEDFASLTFYDWDETLLGTAVINKEATKADIESALDTIHQTRYSSYGAIDLDSRADTWADDEAYPLTYKKGYNFKGWVQVDGGEGTESLADSFTAYETADAFRAEQWDFSTAPAAGWGNIVLKAGYVESESCNQGSGTSYYTVTDFSFNRYGASNNDSVGNYSIKFNARRENTAGNGVTRTKEIGLRMAMTTEDGGVAVYTLSIPENKDVAQGETVVPKSMKSVTITVIEQDGADNYTAAKGRSITNNALVNKNTSSVVSSKGFVYEGTLTFINEQGIANNQGLSNTWGQVNARAFIDAQLTNADGSEMTTAQVNVGKQHLLTALRANENQPLTQAQMLHAVRNSGELIRP